MAKTMKNTSFTRDVQGQYLCNDINEVNAGKTVGTWVDTGFEALFDGATLGSQRGVRWWIIPSYGQMADNQGCFIMQTVRTFLMGTMLIFTSLASLFSLPLSLADEKLNTTKIEQLTGAKGKFDEKEGVFKVNMPRTDLNVTVAGVQMTPPMGLTSWAAFQNIGDQTMVMGDMVVLEDQGNLVMDVALENGLAVTALHNHFFWDSPKVMFMHIGGIGETEKLATAVGKVFTKIKDTSGGKGEVPNADLAPANTTLDPRKIDEIIGKQGEMNNGVYKITIGRTTKMNGHEIGNTMGVNTWAAFVGSDEKAVVDGDFVMFEHELQPVLKALRSAGINVVAIHNHMTEDVPRTVFLHYWGVGLTEKLAKGVKAALETQSK